METAEGARKTNFLPGLLVTKDHYPSDNSLSHAEHLSGAVGYSCQLASGSLGVRIPDLSRKKRQL